MQTATTMDSYHKPVMLEQAISGLNIVPGGIYVDCTFGGGGHAEAILNQLTTGRLFAFDQDPDAAEIAKSIDQQGFHFIGSNFRYLHRYLKMHGITGVDGILADLGVSSHQIDSPERGFSTRFDHLLNMRMDQGSGPTGISVLNEYDEQALADVLRKYGELRNARAIARTIVSERTTNPITSADQLKHALRKHTPRLIESKFLAQVYQALRIEVNEELVALEELLLKSEELVKKGGRVVVISYHSLEDRLVKNYFNSGNLTGEVQKDFYGNLLRPFNPITKKPLVPSELEIKANKRSRSAKLRIAEKN